MNIKEVEKFLHLVHPRGVLSGEFLENLNLYRLQYHFVLNPDQYLVIGSSGLRHPIMRLDFDIMPNLNEDVVAVMMLEMIDRDISSDILPAGIKSIEKYPFGIKSIEKVH